MDSRRQRPRNGRAFGRNHSRHGVRLRAGRRRLHLRGRHDPFGNGNGHQLPAGLALRMRLDLERVRSSLLDRYIRWFASIDSTMNEAARLAAEGCASGTIVVADEQTAGQGRLGRSWYSEPGTGLYLSLVLRYPFPPESLPLITMALGLGVREAIAQTCGVAADLRWPND